MPVSAPVTESLKAGRAFADAYARGDAREAASLLAGDVHEREITPAGVVDQRGRDAVVAEAEEFLDPYGAPEVLDHVVEPLGELVRWSTRWRLRSDGRAWLVEWHAFMTIAAGQVTKLDIVCSGRVPEH